MINSIFKKEAKNSINKYIRSIERYFPYPKKKRLEALNFLEQGIKETMADSNKLEPGFVFGSPRKVAKDFSVNYNWNFEQIGFKIRTIAYIIDVLIGVILFFIFARFLDPLLRSDVLPDFPFPRLILGIVILAPFWVISFNHQIILEVIFSTSIGKRIFGLIVCNTSGIRITWKESIIRNVSKFIPGLVAFELLIKRRSLKDKQRRFLEIYANTIVVKMRKEQPKIPQKFTHQIEFSLNYYFQKIQNWLPYPKDSKNVAMDYLKQEIKEAMKDSGKLDPEEVFGRPYDVAQKYSKNYDWKVTQVGFGVRLIAYTIDVIFSLILFYFWMWILNVLLYPIQWGLIEPFMGNFRFLLESELGFFFWNYLLYGPVVIFILISLWFVSFGHPMILEGLFSTSIGKRFFGIIVVDQSGVRITWNQSFLRNTTKLIPGLVIFEVLTKIFSSNKEDYRRTMDIMADTDVKMVFDKDKLVKLLLLLGLFMVVIYWVSIFSGALLYAFQIY